MPKADKFISFAALKETLKKAGYALDAADITVAGKLVRENEKWIILNESSGQKFFLEGKSLDKLTADIEPNSSVEIIGTWKTVGGKEAAQEFVEPETIKNTDKPITAKTVSSIKNIFDDEKPTVRFIEANFAESALLPVADEAAEKNKPLAPIRTTSPGLTVYQGGAVTPRFYFIKQSLGDLDVYRQVFDLSVSYTPTTKLQVEAEIPFSRTSFDDGVNSGSGSGLGNITLWGKYRFFRKVKTYGDRQAAFRFGFELPTGKKTALTAQAVNAPAFVREQLTPINGGFSPHFDVSFSQAGGRFIYGGNIEGILRTERDGFRLGNEIRLNTDFEYVLLPIDYQKPGKELFLILETTLITRGNGQLGGIKMPGSSSTEFYLSPGLQYAADPQFVIEGSIQIPVSRNSGPLALRTDYNLLLGVKYLF